MVCNLGSAAAQATLAWELRCERVVGASARQPRDLVTLAPILLSRRVITNSNPTGVPMRDSMLVVLLSLLAIAPAIGNSLNAVANENDVVLVWDPSPGVRPWEVYRAVDGSSFNLIGVAPGEIYIDSGALLAPPNFLMYFVVSQSMPGFGPTNVAFRLSHELEPIEPGRSGLNLLSLPFRYFPHGRIGAPANAEDLCTALNGGDPLSNAPVQNLFQFDPLTDLYRVKACANPVPGFSLTPGEGYGVVLHPTVIGPQRVTLVGAHDNAYSANRGGTSLVQIYAAPPAFSGINLISVPYHAIATNARDLCDELNGGLSSTPILALSDFRTDLDVYRTKACSNPLLGFELFPGRAIAARASPGDVGIQFDVEW